MNTFRIFKKSNLAIQLIGLALAIVSFSCSSDDDSGDPTTITITASDFSTTLDENPAQGTSLGTVEASVTEGTVSFAIVSQIPEGAISIDESTGAVIVADETLFDFETNPTIEATIEVSAEGAESVTVTVTISLVDIEEPDLSAFITTWQTIADNESITIQTRSDEYTYNYTIDWGDGTEETGQTEDATHIYATAGTYTVSITGEFPAIVNFTGTFATQLRTIEQWGSIEWQTMESAFRRNINLTYNATDAPDLSQVTTTKSMFQEATSFDGDIDDWDVGSVTDMSSMFFGAESFNGNIGNWDVSNVTDMTSMFLGALVFNQDIGNWDVSNVTNMSEMFLGARSFNQDISNWDVSNVILMPVMFNEADAFNSAMGAWDVSNVTDMASLFEGADSFNQDIGNWDVSNVVDMSFMFRTAAAFNQDIGNWDVGNVTSMFEMFTLATSFDQNLGSWEVSNVTNMVGMFDNSGVSITNYDATLQGWAALPTVQSGVELGANGLIYCDDGETARNTLASKGWTITGDTQGSTQECQ